ncbi:hypothetical protein GCM10027346_21610 [Hymenobacter seoulensis]
MDAQSFLAGEDDGGVPIECLLPQLALLTQCHALLLSDVDHPSYFEERDLTHYVVVNVAVVVFED